MLFCVRAVISVGRPTRQRTAVQAFSSVAGVIPRRGCHWDDPERRRRRTTTALPFGGCPGRAKRCAVRRLAMPSRREDHHYFSNEDDDEGRPFPPSLNSQDEDEGFGANSYDIALDEYDLIEMKQQEQKSRGTNTRDEEIVVASARLPVLQEATVNVKRQSTKGIPTTSSSSIDDDSASDVALIFEESRNFSGDSELKNVPLSSAPMDKVASVEQELMPDPFLSKEASAIGSTKSRAGGPAWVKSRGELEEELSTLESSIHAQSNNKELNINSPKQVANALFGPLGGSTSKGVLEGMAAGGNRLADLILKYRAVKYQIGKISQREGSIAKGTVVYSASTIARASPKRPSGDKKVSSEDPVHRDEISDPLLLLDASAYIFRAYYSMPAIHRSDGMPTGAVMGFCKMLNSMLLDRMIRGEQPRLVLCFDAKGKNFRHELYQAYKANRPAAPMDLVPQFDLVRQAAQAYGICQIEAFSFEADDVIATLATMAVDEGVDANILSGDKDLMQLVTDLDTTPSIQMIDPVKKDRTTFKQVVEKWEVPPNKLGDVLALAGDTADNIPGVKGIGPKGAAKLINEFDSLENLLNNIDDVQQKGLRDKLIAHESDARLSRVLVELNRTVPLNMISGLPDGDSQKIGDLRMEPFDPDRILAFYDQMGFRELKRTFEFRLKGVKAKRRVSSYGRAKTTIPQPGDYSDVPF